MNLYKINDSTRTMDRREILAAAAVAAGTGLAASLLPTNIATSAATRSAWLTGEPFALPKLEYAYDALEPHIDALTMEIHHARHHAAYVNGLNAAVMGTEFASRKADELVTMWKTLPEPMQKGVRNAGGGHVNHTLFWTTLSPKGGGQPRGNLLSAIEKSFGNFDACWDKLAQTAVGVFGSGWAWLSWNRRDGLIVESTANQDSPLSHGNAPLFGIDVWEHAYYLKHQNQRANYVAALRNVVSWDRVQERWLAAQKITSAMQE